jgi:hypothetical protein
MERVLLDALDDLYVGMKALLTEHEDPSRFIQPMYPYSSLKSDQLLNRRLVTPP